ncbi:hypothetical protein ACJZ2D_001542 [Fusarium nematophilum]
MNNLQKPQKASPPGASNSNARPPDPHHENRRVSGDAPTANSNSAPKGEQSSSDGPGEAMCRRTTFFVNADWRMGSTLASATNIVGQMYVECLDPLQRVHPYPIVLIHGDFHTGQTAKPDGQPGWASFFLREGYQVYLVDLPPCGRSNFLTGAHFVHRDLAQTSHTITATFVERELTAPGKPYQGAPLIHARARFHDKWPGTGQRGDPIFANYCASLTTLHLNKVERQSLSQNALQALLHQIGKSVLVGEGTGGNMAWLATDVEPDLVAGVVAIEPAGPPFGSANAKRGNPHRLYSQFIQRGESNRIYGLADIPLTYDPPTHSHEGFDPPAREPLDITRVVRPDHQGACFMQRRLDDSSGGNAPIFDSDGNEVQDSPLATGKCRQLIHLKKVPHALITAHASPHALFDWATAAFMQQAGVSVDWLRLEDYGLYGNGHLMFLEMNSDEVARLILQWVTKRTVPVTFADVLPEPLPSMPRAVPGQAAQSSAEGRRHPVVESASRSLHSDSTTSSHGSARTQSAYTPRAPAERVPGHPQDGSSSQAHNTGNSHKRPAPSTGSSDANHSSSPGSSSGWGLGQKRPRLEQQPSRSDITSAPQGPDLTNRQPASHLRNSGRGQDGEHPISDLAMMRPSHPGGGPAQLRQRLVGQKSSPAASPSGSQTSLPAATRPMYARSSNLYEHLPVGQSSMPPRGDSQHHPSYGSTHSTARFERQLGTAEESIAALAIANQRAMVASSGAPSSQNLPQPPLRQTCHGNPAVQSPVPNGRGQVHTSTPVREPVTTGQARTPVLPPSSLASGHLNAYDDFQHMTPPSPSPAPRGSSNPVSGNASAGSPATFHGSETQPASK